MNTELHPDDPNLFDTRAEGYEVAGDNEKMKKMSQQLLELLASKTQLTDTEKSLTEVAEKD